MQRSTRQSNGRKYNRTGNSFKFHNFVFNEDNQSFCLEEQHGNKKITVLHWKKSEDGSVDEEDCSSEPVSLCKSGKTISRQLSKTSSDSTTSANKRRTVDVTTSASFPPPSSRQSSVAASSVRFSCPFKPEPHSTESSLPQSSHSPSPTTNTTLNIDQCPLPTPVPFPSDDQRSSKSSARLEDSISKSNASSSSIATSSSSSSSQVANWLNQSLHDLDLTEFPRKTSSNRQNSVQVRHELSSELDKSDDEDEDDDSDDDMLSDTDRINVFQKYREYLQQLEGSRNSVQTQPLDLSIKSKRDLNNNSTRVDWNIDSILGFDRTINKEKDQQSVCDSLDSSNSYKIDRLKQGFDRMQVPSSNLSSDWDSTKSPSSVRSEALSPSTLISSMKCCSPSSHQSTSSTDHNLSSMNPFMFQNPLLSYMSSSIRHSHDHRNPQSSAVKNDSTESSHYHQPLSKTRHQYMFDTFLEEEISKMLQSSSKQSNESMKSEPYDIEERIEDKLRLLHREVLNRKELFENNLEPSQDNLRMHFKLNSNKAPESGSPEDKRFLSEPCLHQALLSKIQSRPISRNQIKRQLEDTFKQNGFLVKTKQVSDANNSAMFCKFRQLRKYTRYYLKSWQNHLPDEVNKLWKGFLPPKTERPLYFGSSTTTLSPESFSSSSSMS